MATPQARPDVLIRPLRESELAEADRIFRVAFSTFLGLPTDNPRMTSDAAMVRTRWKADPLAVLAAEHAGKLVGTNFATNWGSFGFFGPLTVEPAYWDRGVAQQLLAPTMELFRHRGHRHLGLYTFANSPKHIALYQKYGFWPRDLVAIMGRAVQPGHAVGRASYAEAALFSQSSAAGRAQLLAGCRDVTDAIFEGLDLEREIGSVCDQRLGDTVLVFEGSRLGAFAVCHAGAGSEAGSGVCYVKFAAARGAGEFARLLDAVETFARAAGALKITAGVNLARRDASSEMISRGFRTEMQGVAMETGDARSGYNRAGVCVLDDWR